MPRNRDLACPIFGRLTSHTPFASTCPWRFLGTLLPWPLSSNQHLEGAKKKERPNFSASSRFERTPSGERYGVLANKYVSDFPQTRAIQLSKRFPPPVASPSLLPSQFPTQLITRSSHPPSLPRCAMFPCVSYLTSWTGVMRSGNLSTTTSNILLFRSRASHPIW